VFSSDDNEDVFREGIHRRLLDLVTLRALKEDAAGSCKISAYFYQTARHHNQSNIHFIADISKTFIFYLFKGVLVEFVTKMPTV